jgi:diguanylate cyclase (GGDEF)-like protein
VSVRKWLRCRTYAVIGGVLSLGAPLGLLAVEALLAEGTLTPAWVVERLRDASATYSYVALSTAVAFSTFGWVVGRKSDQLDEASLTDALTGLGNRRHFDQRLREELARAARYQTPLALLLIDVDGLKVINDRGGHEAGDLALRRVAEAIAKTARRTDAAARVGGDEFALLVPETANDAISLAERVRGAAAADGDEPVSVSIGIADLSHTPSFDAAELYRAADRALYASKASGRNRASLAPVLEGPSLHS